MAIGDENTSEIRNVSFHFPSAFLEDDMSRESNEIYEFGPFRLNVDEHVFECLDGSKNGSLPEKAFQTLTVLLRNSGKLVTKDELLSAVWPDTIVEENNLDKAIHAVRQALGEKPGEQKFVETVRKHGYRFVAEVTQVSKAATLPHSEAIASPVAYDLAKRSNTRLVLFGLGFLTAIGLIVLLSFNFRSGSVGDPNGPRSIAVLPLKPIGAVTRDELYEFGIAEAFINKLALMKGVVVRPLSETRKYSDIDQDPIAAGREQKVDYVLAANYQIAEGKVRITAQLFNVESELIEDTYKVEKDAGSIFALQDAMADEVGDRLLTWFGAVAKDVARRRQTNNEDAYRLYLQAMYLYDQRTAAASGKAVALLDQAVRLDPNYAQAWAGKAHAHLASHFGRNIDLTEQHEKTLDAINKALALDTNSADAHSAQCEAKLGYEWDFVGAEAACRRALQLDPYSARAHQIYARFLNSRGRFDEAIAEINTAIDLEPASLFNQQLLGVCLHYARRYDEAVAQFKRLIEINEDFNNAYMWLSRTLALQGNDNEAFEIWMKVLAHQSRKAEDIRAFQTAFQTSGWQGVMRVRAERFGESNEQYFHGAAYNAMIGEKDTAFSLLEKSLQRREWGIAYLEVEPLYDALRGDPRFDELISRAGFK